METQNKGQKEKNPNMKPTAPEEQERLEKRRKGKSKFYMT